MAITSTGFQSPATARVGLVPSVYDKIMIVGADETPLLAKLGKSKVTGITHSWLIDHLADPKKNAQKEISDFDETMKSTKQQQTNAVQIFKTEVAVSRTMQAVKTYGGKELENETGKRAKEHKLDMEYALFGLGRNSDVKTSVFKEPTLRTDDAAGEMAGIFHYIAKGEKNFSGGRRGNVFAFDSTQNWTGAKTVLTEEELNQILQSIWDKGATPKDVFIGANLKRAINKMATRQFGNEKKLNTMVTSLETDFGVVNFRLHRFLSAKYELDDVLIAGDFSFMKMGLLIPTEITDVTTSKTAKQKRFYTEGCLEVRNADAFAIGVGLKS
ncbi:SU10 major capsid protein [Campylobacter pinnipediorum]|uniref:Major capsid protein n=1 Tax=Campylobacter pinnipediorum subsp. pinnipediorum TaxID=1660067 RepID=A0AAX0LAD4_9BACT|nr:DUF5309 family protein [Campylobacter pinnipediorum]AQW81368.1 hypothetical protein CPIN17260_1079 [Campylobacter pinnipediorum subsp. pinnipediorum]AQW82993.1 hypothetical protein CPIN17261_0989 [Campylobacter pinnipediorum subsp. pinnipediorum]OPA77336.1 hypothetical protein BFG04_04370 [Campylobacter pinnipediorum subsp. pinnipediorum]